MRLISELRRRNVLRMAVLYALAAWLIVQVAGVLIDLAKLPDWIGTTTLWLLAVGFPIALIFAWFYEITPEGISLEKHVDPDVSIAHVTGRRLNFIVISLLCAAVILFAYDKWWMPGPPEKSIAVLAFDNMSGDPDQEYFSDGISEELLNLLARIPELSVTSRTSAFYFKDKDIGLADIAKQLNVAYVLEGSVRKEDTTFRITAQLIEASSDTHIWSHTYEENLSGIFAVQDEVARQVVDKLKVTLLGELPRAHRVNPDAYALVLEAQNLRALQTRESLESAQELYELALDLEPGYARAWVGLSKVRKNQVDIGERPTREGCTVAEKAARKALEYDPESGAAYDSLASIKSSCDSDTGIAARFLERALSLDPENKRIQANAGIFLHVLGRFDEAILILESYMESDPVNAIGHFNLGSLYLANEDFEKARASLSKTLVLSPKFYGAHYMLGIIDLFEDEPESALTRFDDEPDDEYRIKGRALAFFALGRKGDSDAALAELIAGWGQDWPPEVAQVYAYRGEIDKAFEWLGDEDENSGGWGEGRFEPLLWNLHEDPRWQTFLAKVGVADKDLSAIVFDVSIPK